MVCEDILLGHKFSKKGIEMDKTKIEVIERLPLYSSIYAIRSFLGYARFYRRIIKDFLNVTKPLCALLPKVVVCVFVDACLETFNKIKEVFTSAPIIIALD